MVLILPILNAQAYDPFYPGSLSNPLYFQISPDPTQWYEQTLRDQQMKMYQQNQERYQQQMLQQQRDLQSQLLQQRIYSQPIQRKGTLCNGNYWNACPAGNNFVCPSTGSAYCEVSKTNEPILPYGCVSTSGYSATSGVPCGEETTKSTTTCNGKEWNDCPIGQKFYCPPTGDAQCVTTLKTETKVAPTIKKVAEVKTTKAQIDESFANYEGLNPASANTATSTTEVKPKGFWTRLKGWLGF